MTQAELYAALKTLGLPVAYRQFKSTPKEPAPAPPFICYLFTYAPDVRADNRNYVRVSAFRIELYTDAKDPEREAAVEALLDSLGLTYGKSESWLESEKLQEVAYEVQIV